MMNDLDQRVLEVAGAKAIKEVKEIQSLWGGYGAIKRYSLEGGGYSSLIVKHIVLPDESNHPRGWNTNLSHQRKLRSYEVEMVWYAQYAHLTNDDSKVPVCLFGQKTGDEFVMILEDLDGMGFNQRQDPDSVSLTDMKQCLSWLAHFHSKFMSASADGLWSQGTYWHLDTRPDEWDRMENVPLKEAARAIDERLNAARYQTFVHGDAKLANFCFGDKRVAGVDFQYIGRGCGIKDVAYFLSSCLDEDECEKYEKELLDFYFDVLELSLDNCFDYQAIKNEWRRLYDYAWADFYRFLDGWSPGHWKMHNYSKRITRKVLNEIAVK